MEKRKLFLDLDGCILDFEHAYIPILEQEGIYLNVDDFKEWDLLKSRGYTRRQVYRFVVKAWESDNFENLPYLAGAEKFLQWAARKYKVIYNTTVPEAYREKRVKNLNKLDILEAIGAEVRFATSHRDKARIVGSYDNGFAFIDDKPKNVSSVKQDWPDIISIWYNHRGLMSSYDHDPKPDFNADSWSKVKNYLQKKNGQ
jgi:hypothetical protein